jgi:hypothetical protein
MTENFIPFTNSKILKEKAQNYLIHFFYTGDFKYVEQVKGIKNAWQVLKDWSLMFKSIVNILSHFIDDPKKFKNDSGDSKKFKL